MGTKDWFFKGTKLITNTKKQRLKIENRGWIFKNTILKKRRRRKKNATRIIKKTTTTTQRLYMAFALRT